MIRTVEAVIDQEGEVHLLEPVRPSTARRALVTILNEHPVSAPGSSRASQASVVGDWNRPEEDEAWAGLQPQT